MNLTESCKTLTFGIGIFFRFFVRNKIVDEFLETNSFRRSICFLSSKTLTKGRFDEESTNVIFELILLRNLQAGNQVVDIIIKSFYNFLKIKAFKLGRDAI